jgi:large subunit ribosomal protein L17
MKTSHRLAMLRNMATSLFLHERIRTTDSRAKELRRVAERMITLGKRGDLHARRRAAAVLRGAPATQKLFTELADRYREVAGGYTRIVKLGLRRGDGATLSLVELVQPQQRESGRKKKTSRKAAAKKAPAKTVRAKRAEPKAKAASKTG